MLSFSLDSRFTLWMDFIFGPYVSPMKQNEMGEKKKYYRLAELPVLRHPTNMRQAYQNSEKWI